MEPSHHGNLSLGAKDLSLQDIIEVARGGAKVELAPQIISQVERSRETVEGMIADNRVVYGITTGFGKFADISISPDETADLQRNLIMSHACGVGKPLPVETTRAMLLLRANSLLQGFSGIKLDTLKGLLSLLNNDINPVVPEKGSLGSSGDLCPLSHLVLPLLGLGEATYKGQLMSGADALAQAGLQPISLAAKEGLALNNGTQAMTAIGALTLIDALELMEVADLAAALSLEALNGLQAALDPRIHQLRRQSGQQISAAKLRKYVEGSTYCATPGERVQDAYALRCIPQVHGASRDALTYVKQIIENEINAVTDNPLIFSETDQAISGGNFHGQPIALAMDFLGIALAELANISERRLERLVNPALSNGLPGFLAPQSGLHSGMMIVQYSAAALVSENKVLAHPASVDSIPSSGNQEDHVSMGTIAARKAREILENVRQVIAMELLCAALAIDLRPQAQLGAVTSKVYDAVRSVVDAMLVDRVIAPDIAQVAALIKDGTIAALAKE